jgi:hypothetical protein
MIFALALSLALPAQGGIIEVEDLPELNRVIVRDLTGESIPAEHLAVVAEYLTLELRKLKGLEVVAMSDLRTLLEIEIEKQVMGCEDDESCLAELADSFGADGWLSGSIATVGQERIFALARFDARTAKVTHRAQMRMALGEGDELLSAIGPAVEQLFPDLELHADAVRGVDPAVEIEPPPVDARLTWGALGAGGVAVLVAGGLALGYAVEYGQAEALLASDEPVSGAVINQHYGRAVPLAIGAQVAAGLAGALLLTGGVLSPFTDF